MLLSDLHLLVQVHVDHAVLDLALRVCIPLARPIDNHLPGLLVLAKLVDELVGLDAVERCIGRQAPDSGGVVAVVDDVLVSEHLADTELGKSHGGAEMGLHFQNALLHGCFVLVLLRRSEQHPL